MNANLYKLVFSKKSESLVPVAEFVSGHGAAARTSSIGEGLIFRLKRLWLALAISIGVFGSAFASNLPVGGTIATGSGAISQTGSTLTVQQETKKLGVNWQSFDIAKGNTVIFQQPDASSVALNRVTGGTRSEIYGNLQANGQVFVVNPNGILFGRTAEVNVGGLFATTKNISDTDFAAGNYKFTGNGGFGEVINQGNLRASKDGYIALVADQVRNEGNIFAEGGQVALAAGGGVTLNLDHSGLSKVNVDTDTLHALVENKGLIAADGGAVTLTAHGRDMLQANVMNLEGIVYTRTRNGKSGSIQIDAGKSGTLQLDSAVFDLTGLNAGERGGSFSATGRDINVANSRIDARGYSGGGTVLVGGDFQGGGQLAHAQTLKVDAPSRIDASATQNGHGGKVVLWSDDFTEYHGGIKARGGDVAGNGGLVEVSGKRNLQYQATEATDTRAAHGRWGTLYLDPANISITHGAAGGATSSGVSGSPGNQSITDGQIVNELLTTGVVLSATDTISDASDVKVVSTTGSSLTLNSANVNLSGGYGVDGGLIFNVSGTGVSTGLISGNGGITKRGSGTMTIAPTSGVESGAYTYRDNRSLSWYGGDTVIEAGTLEFRDVRRMSSANYNISANAVLEVNRSAVGLGGDDGMTRRYVNSTIRGDGTFRKTGAGDYAMASNGDSQQTFDLTANGLIDIRDGKLWETAAAATNRATLNVSAGADFGINDDGVSPSKSYYGQVNGAGTIGKYGQGSGKDRTLVLGNGNATGGLFSGQITNLVGSSGGSLSIEKTGTGTQTFTGNSNYSGTTLVSCGTLQVGDNGTSGNLGTGAVTTNANLVFNRSDSVAISSIASNSAAITGTGNFTALIGGGFTVDRSIALTGAGSTVRLEAGKNQSAGTVGGGDISYSGGATVGTSATGTVVMFSGNPNTATLDAGVTGATGATRYKTYNASEASLSTAQTGTRNYYFRNAPTATLSGTVVARKTYDGTDAVVGGLDTSGAALTGAVDGDQFTNASIGFAGSATYNTTHVGNNLALAGASINANSNIDYTSGGQSWSVKGYSITDSSSKAGTITPRDLTIKINNVTKVYDGNTNASGTGVAQANTTAFNGLAAGDAMSGITGTGQYNDKHVVNANSATFNVNNLSYNLSGGGFASDYNITVAGPDSATITKANAVATGSVVASDKTYDGTNTAVVNVSGLSVTGVNGETLGVNSSTITGQFDSVHVGNNRTVTTANIAISDGTGLASDYNLPTLNTTATANITPRALTVQLNNITKTYDGNDNAIAAGGVAQSNTSLYNGLVAGDSFNNVTGNGLYNSAHVANANTASFAPGNLSANVTGVGNASDYNITYLDPVSASITKKTVVVTGNVTAADKTYDGSNSATVNGSGLGLSGLVGTETLNIASANVTGVFDNTNVGTRNVSLNMTNAIADGTGLLSDYDITNLPTTAAANITPRTVHVNLSGVTKTYDGTTALTANLTPNWQQQNNATAQGLVGTEQLGLSYNATYADPHANTNVAIDLTNVTLANQSGLVGNYNVVLDKPTITGGGSRTLSTTPSDVQGGTTGVISPKFVDVALSRADARPYDGTAGNVNGINQTWNGLIGNEDLALRYNPTYADKNVGNQPINLADVSVANGSGRTNDYVVRMRTENGYTDPIGGAGNPSTVLGATGGTINKAPLTVAAQPDDKVYDGTTNSKGVPTCQGVMAGESCTGLEQSFRTIGPGESPIDPRLAGIANGQLDNYDVSYVIANGVIRAPVVKIEPPDVKKPVFVAQTPPDRNRPQRSIDETATRSQDQDRIVVTQSQESVLLASAYTYNDINRAAELADYSLGGSPAASGAAGTSSSSSNRRDARTEADVAINEVKSKFTRPESGVFCAQGAIRIPQGVVPYGVKSCTVERG